jgi:outer membrane protein assembly factor BamA
VDRPLFLKQTIIPFAKWGLSGNSLPAYEKFRVGGPTDIPGYHRQEVWGSDRFSLSLPIGPFSSSMDGVQPEEISIIFQWNMIFNYSPKVKLSGFFSNPELAESNALRIESQDTFLEFHRGLFKFDLERPHLAVGQDLVFNTFFRTKPTGYS